MHYYVRVQAVVDRANSGALPGIIIPQTCTPSHRQYSDRRVPHVCVLWIMCSVIILTFCPPNQVARIPRYLARHMICNSISMKSLGYDLSIESFQQKPILALSVYLPSARFVAQCSTILMFLYLFYLRCQTFRMVNPRWEVYNNNNNCIFSLKFVHIVLTSTIF